MLLSIAFAIKVPCTCIFTTVKLPVEIALFTTNAFTVAVPVLLIEAVVILLLLIMLSTVACPVLCTFVATTLVLLFKLGAKIIVIRLLAMIS